MFKKPKGLPKDAASHITSCRDRSTIFKQVLLDASIENKFGFQERDILPLFVKYHTKRQIIIDFFSFSTYVLQLPTKFYLRRLQKNKLVLNRKINPFIILKPWRNKNMEKPI